MWLNKNLQFIFWFLTDTILLENEPNSKMTSKNMKANPIPGFEMETDTFIWFCLAVGICLIGLPLLYIFLPRCVQFPYGCVSNLCLPFTKCMVVTLCFPCLCVGKLILSKYYIILRFDLEKLCDLQTCFFRYEYRSIPCYHR